MGCRRPQRWSSFPAFPLGLALTGCNIHLPEDGSSTGLVCWGGDGDTFRSASRLFCKTSSVLRLLGCQAAAHS